MTSEGVTSRYRPLAVGPRLSVWPPVVLAPMAGVTNWPYRQICRELGAALCTSEMISSRGILEGSFRTWKLARFGPGEAPRSIQIFGCEPDRMAEATRRLLGDLGVDHIDINFGCPVPKIISKGMGAAAVLDADNFRRVVRAVVGAAGPVPVTIKVRLGMDEDRFTFREAGRVAEGEGCAAIALHARTAKQMYSGKSRWEYVRELKESVRIPVLGNGDIFQAADALRRMDETGCDAVVIGRGCLGNPWLFRDLVEAFHGRPVPPRPGVEEIVAVLRRHFALLQQHHADHPRLACLEARRFGGWYVHGLRGAAALRRAFQGLERPEDLETVLESVAGYRTPR